MPGLSDDFCAGGFDGGPGGQQCATCGGDCSTGTCLGGSFCNWTNCSGCCMPDGTCWTGPFDEKHCGSDGQLCVDCGPGYACDMSSVCTISCNPQNCQGCCAAGICSPGTDTSTCGTGGEACAPCGGNQACVNGACIDVMQCGNVLCGGCCDGNQVCQAGAADSACGSGGVICQDCSDGGHTCMSGMCSP